MAAAIAAAVAGAGADADADADDGAAFQKELFSREKNIQFC